MNNNLIKMVLTSVLIAMATALSFIKPYQLPMGGSITLLSMLPIVMIGLMFGLKWGFSGAFIYSLIQLAFGIAIDGLLGWGLNSQTLIACMLLDYIVAFSALGLAGLFRNKGIVGMCGGIAIGLTLRFVCHFISGVVLFANFDFPLGPAVYSLAYNGSFMLPELIFTLIGAFVLFRLPQINKLMDSAKA